MIIVGLVGLVSIVNILGIIGMIGIVEILTFFSANFVLRGWEVIGLIVGCLCLGAALGIFLVALLNANTGP